MMPQSPNLKLREDRIYNFRSRQSDGAASLYVRIADELIQQVTAASEAGPLLLPQERDLAARFNVSRSTIRQALTLLEQYDLVQRRRGHGTLMTRPAEQTLQVWRLRNKHVLLLQFSSGPIRHNVGYYGRILAGIVAEAKTQRQNLEVKYLYYSGEVPRTYRELPDRERIAGVMISGMFDDSFLGLFTENDIPCVCVDYWPHDQHTDAVTVDVEAEAFLAAEHLARIGCRTLGVAAFGRRKHGEQIVRFDPDVWRFIGNLRRAANRHGLLMRDEWIMTIPGTDQVAQRAMDRFFMLEQLPEAMLCFDETVATRTVEALRRRGLKYPDDINVITRSAEPMSQDLTRLQSRPEQIGQTAMRMLLDRIYHRRDYPMRVGVSSMFVPGESTRQPEASSFM